MTGESGDVLRELVDHQEITALAVRYCWTIDGHDWDGLDEVFTPEATADFGSRGLLVGREQIKGRIRNALGPLDASGGGSSTATWSSPGPTATSK